MCLFTETETETLNKRVMKKEVSLTQDSKFIMHFIQKYLKQGFFVFSLGWRFFVCFNHSFISSVSGCSFSQNQFHDPGPFMNRSSSKMKRNEQLSTIQ